MLLLLAPEFSTFSPSAARLLHFIERTRDFHFCCSTILNRKFYHPITQKFVLRCDAMRWEAALLLLTLLWFCIVVKSSHCIVVASRRRHKSSFVKQKSGRVQWVDSGQFSGPSTWHSPRLAVIYHVGVQLVLSHCNFDFYCSSFAMNSPSICKQSKQFIKASITWIYASRVESQFDACQLYCAHKLCKLYQSDSIKSILSSRRIAWQPVPSDTYTHTHTHSFMAREARVVLVVVVLIVAVAVAMSNNRNNAYVRWKVNQHFMRWTCQATTCATVTFSPCPDNFKLLLLTDLTVLLGS